MATVRLAGVTKRYAAQAALDDVSLDVASGEFVTLLGPSGCGKSTTLRAIAGLSAIDGGRVQIGDADVTDLPTARRNIGMVFQNLALFPHMTAAENVAFGLKMRGVAPAAQRERAAQALDLVRLSGLGARYPHQLSGGQQQRVAIARALVVDPAVLLLDEPFAALDRKLREAMQVELRELTRRLGMTAMFVTHDQEEALTLSDRIAVMSAGRIEQIGTPAALYERPASRFVADFMGVANILPVTIRAQAADRIELGWGPHVLLAAPQPGWPASGDLEVGIRPERLDLLPAGPARAGCVPGVVRSALYQGAFSSYSIATDPDAGAPLIVRLPGGAAQTVPRFAPGDAVAVEIPPGAVIPLAPTAPLPR